jgi:hypothetical protein
MSQKTILKVEGSFYTTLNLTHTHLASTKYAQ